MSLDEGGAFPGPADGATLTGPVKNPIANDGSYVFLIWQRIYDIYQVQSRLGSLALPRRSGAGEEVPVQHRKRRALAQRSGRSRPIVSDPNPERVTGVLDWFDGVSSDGTASAAANWWCASPSRAGPVRGGRDFRARAGGGQRLHRALVALIIIGAIAACVITSIIMSRRTPRPSAR
jgi:hypothetical protein